MWREFFKAIQLPGKSRVKRCRDMQDQRIRYQAAVEEMKITSLLLIKNGKRNHIKNDGLYCE